jgi:hypothetical protein
MVWPITLTRSVTGSKVIHCSLAAALEVLHDPPSLIEMNPIVLSKTADPSNRASYRVTDRLLVFGYFHTQTTYTCTFSFCDDGVDVDVNAGAGTKGKTRWRARAVESGTEVCEEVSMQVCSKFYV